MPVRTLAILVGLVATILVGWVLHVSAGILQPLVIAAFLCSMLQPVVRWLAKRYVPPPVTVIVLVTLLFLGIARVGVWAQKEVYRFVGAAPGTTTQTSVPPSRTALPPGDPAGNGGAGELESAAPTEGADAPPAEPGELGDPGETSGGGSDPATTEPGAAEEELASGDGTGPPQDEEPSGEGGDAESDEEQPERNTIAWSGIIQNLEALVRDTNLPEPLKEFLIASMKGIDAQALAIGFAGNTFGFFTGLLLVVIYMLFIFAEQAIFRRKILSVAGDRADNAADALGSIARGVQRYLSVKTVVSLATGILCYSVLEGLKVPYAHFFGFLTFLLNYIPTFGSLVAGGLATLTTFASKGSWESALIVAIAYLSVNLTLGSYIEPRILGRELNLSPLVIVISVVVWAGLWGIAGTFLAVPLMATMQIILANSEATRPIAILLSSGPPREERTVGIKKKKKKKAPTPANYPGS